MQRVIANSRLASAIQLHRPPSLGRLWLDCFDDKSVVSPGFVEVLIDTSNQNDADTIVAFVDPNIFPPISLYYGCAAFENVSGYVANRLKESLSFRAVDLKPPTDALRVVNGRRDYVPGLTVDLYTKEYSVIGVFSAFWQSQMTGLLDIILDLLPSMKSVSLTRKLAKGNSSYKSHTIYGNNSGICEITEVNYF